jgi:hypothetical protein
VSEHSISRVQLDVAPAPVDETVADAVRDWLLGRGIIAANDASTGGRDRLAWNGVYLRCPETADERDRTLRHARDDFEQAFRGFDRDRYPVWRDWLAGAAAHPRRAPLIGRMRRAGVLDLPGALEGW